jgi:TetR/AcrR family transcriptional regulator, cholesterol catabolism regulator
MVQITGSGPRRPRRSHGDRKTEILRQAADAFRTHGFHGVGMREIAKTLGMTPGNLYYYFESKDDLLYVCQKTALTTLLASARRAVRSTASPEAKIRAIVVAHLHCLLEETGGSAAHLEFRALPGARRAELARQRDAYERLIGRIIGDGIAGGAFRPADPRLATLAMLGTLNSTVVWWRPDGPRPVAEVADAFASFILGGLVGCPTQSTPRRSQAC